MRRAVFYNLATNAALCAIVLSVGAVCLLPQGEAVATEGGEPIVYRSAGKDTGAVSLMFNVYWGTEEVYAILDILDDYEAKCTFFIGGSWADDNVECLKEIASRGHELGNHGYFHKDHKTLDARSNRQEIENCNQFIALATGVTPTLFAPPSGSYGKTALEITADLNMKTILWSKDTIDWRDKDEALVYKRATENISGGDFVLMHPMQATKAALPNVLRYYQDNGLKAVTVTQNLQKEG